MHGFNRFNARAAWIASVAVLGVLSQSLAAVADTLTIQVDGRGTWSDVVAAVQRDVSSEGESLNVYVTDGSNERIRCGEYVLQPDTVTSAAFSIRECDPSTSVTRMTLRDRHALFAHEDPVPRPLPAGLVVVQTRRSEAIGQAEQPGAGEVVCSVAVRPYLTDLEHGTRVYLVPGRYQMRVAQSYVRAVSVPDGWNVQSSTEGSLVVEYDVVDTTTETVAFSGRATLACGEGSNASDPPGEARHADAVQTVHSDARALLDDIVRNSSAHASRVSATGETRLTRARGIVDGAGGVALLAMMASAPVFAGADYDDPSLRTRIACYTAGGILLGGGSMLLAGAIINWAIAKHQDRAAARAARVSLLGVGVAPTPGGAGASIGVALRL